MKKKILVVEDEESLRLLYEEELKSEGYEVLTAGNGREAIELLETGKPDLIILDIVMPQTDGVWFLKNLRAHPTKTKIPVIVFTNLSEGEKVSSIVALGEYRLLVKAQTSLETLVNTVKEVLRLYQ